MRFQNLDPRHRRPTRWEVFRWLVLDRLTGRRQVAPAGRPAPSVVPDLALMAVREGPACLTWLGHAGVMGRLGACRFLIDPVFSRRIGLFYPRYGVQVLAPAQPPPVDLLLVTHNHYDHLDAATVLALDRSATVIAPSQLGRWFCRLGFARVIELGWWEHVEVDGLRVTSVPARHWSHRRPFDINRTLWTGYVLEGGPHSLYHAGDTAWFDTFTEIGQRFHNLTVAMLPIGGYEPVWFMQHNHLTPEQAGEAFAALGARSLLPIHWGTFQMTDEPLCEPIERLRGWWQSRSDLDGRELLIPAVGETLHLD